VRRETGAPPTLAAKHSTRFGPYCEENQKIMNDKAGSDKDDRKPIGGELLIPIMAFVFTLYYFWTILDVPWSAQVSAFFVGTILIVLLIVFFFRSAAAIRRGEASLQIGPLFDPIAFVPKRLALLGLTLGFIFIVQYLGFTITVFLFLTSSMLLLSNGKKKRLIVCLSATLALAGWALFIWAFETRFPAGPFETMMKGLI
jgi:hypothetical protein